MAERPGALEFLQRKKRRRYYECHAENVRWVHAKFEAIFPRPAGVKDIQILPDKIPRGKN